MSKHDRPMDPEEFRRLGHEFIDWMADYQAGVGDLAVNPSVQPGALRKALPPSPPEEGEDMAAIFSDFQKKVMPGVLHWNHPRFFAYFPSNTSGPAILGEMLSAVLGVNGMLWETCPAATELEEHVLDWLRQLIGLPDTFTGVIQDTASSSTLVALLQARERSTKGTINPQGFAVGEGLTVYTSAEAHSSILKGARIAGFGDQQVISIPTDENLAMIPLELAKRVKADREAGLRPCAVVASVGTTSSTAVDPLDAIADVCEAEDLFLHVDAALAGSAAILPEARVYFKGYERADSFVFNPHKWLFTNFDCSAHFVKNPQELQRTFAIHPEYLKTAVDGEVTNFKDWGVALGRRFRALKLWFVLRYFGAEGLRSQLRAHLKLTQGFADWVDHTPGLTRLALVPFITVCFRVEPAGLSDESEIEALNQKVLDRLRTGGKVYLTHTRLNGVFCLRVAIGQTWTQKEDVEILQEEIRAAIEAVQQDSTK